MRIPGALPLHDGDSFAIHRMAEMMTGGLRLCLNDTAPAPDAGRARQRADALFVFPHRALEARRCALEP